MQRLSSWFENLPLRRRSSQRNSGGPTRSRKTSKSAAPAIRCPFVPPSNNKKPSVIHQSREPVKSQPPFYNHNTLSSARSAWDTMSPRSPSGPSPQQYLSPVPSLEHSSLIRDPRSMVANSPRQTIRTNPWVRRDRPSLRAVFPPSLPPSHLSFYSMDRSTASGRSTGLVDSTCSSGYGSQDNTPESSVHSPDWKEASQRADKAVECRSIDVDEALGFLEESSSFDGYHDLRHDDYGASHIYHELEFSDHESKFPIRVTRERVTDIYEDNSSDDSVEWSSRSHSPVYARPYEAPSPSPRFPSPPPPSEPFRGRGRSLPRPPRFHAPPPPQREDEEALMDEMELVELEFLAELDQQIAELQQKSEAVRVLVDEARERRVRGSSMGAEWRRAHWRPHNFELCL